MSRYTHLTTDERKSIAELFYQGCSTREIARRLDRDPSTISRELRRNRAQVAANCTLYHPGAADMAYKERRKRCVRKHVLSDRELHHAVHFALGHLYWSPEQMFLHRYIHHLPGPGVRIPPGFSEAISPSEVQNDGKSLQKTEKML